MWLLILNAFFREVGDMTGDPPSVSKPDTSAVPYKAPLSGPILGAVVRELRLQNDVLMDKTARRYFSGQRIKDDNKHEIFLAIGEELVAHGVIPESPVLERVGLPLEKILSLGIGCSADHWDRLVGHMRYTSAPVDRPDLAAISYLRLAIIDLSLRISAALWLAELPTPDEETPLWAKNKGGATYLRQLLDRCGVPRPTREQLAEDLEVSDNTIDNWLDTNIRPSRDNIDRIADALAPHIDGLDADTLKSQLHRHYALCALCDFLATHIGRDEVVDLATALVRFTSRTLDAIRQSNELVPEDAARVLLPVTLFGTQFGASLVAREHLLPALWHQERDRVWRTDLMAASSPWHLRLTHVAQHLGGLDQAIQTLHEEYGIPIEVAKGQMDQVLRGLQADQTRLDIRDPSELEGKTLFRVKGDAKFSAGNRMIQYAQAKSEGDLETAILHVRRAVELQPESAMCHFHLGAALGMAGEVEEGIQECWVSASLDPDWELPRVEVGIILLNAGRSQEAREHLESMACGQDVLSPHLAFNLGVARLRTSDAAGALDALEQAIEAEPDHARALDIAAHCAFLTGDEVKGRRLAKLADQLGHSETYREWMDGKYRAGKRPT